MEELGLLKLPLPTCATETPWHQVPEANAFGSTAASAHTSALHKGRLAALAAAVTSMKELGLLMLPLPICASPRSSTRRCAGQQSGATPTSPKQHTIYQSCCNPLQSCGFAAWLPNADTANP